RRAKSPHRVLLFERFWARGRYGWAALYRPAHPGVLGLRYPEWRYRGRRALTLLRDDRSLLRSAHQRGRVSCAPRPPLRRQGAIYRDDDAGRSDEHVGDATGRISSWRPGSDPSRCTAFGTRRTLFDLRRCNCANGGERYRVPRTLRRDRTRRTRAR